MIDAVYWLNLEKRKDRREHMEANVIPYLGVPSEIVHRVEAIDATNEDTPSKRAAGCSLTHLKIWDMAESRKQKTILVLEDDFVFVREPKEFHLLTKRLFEELPNFKMCNIAFNSSRPIALKENKGFYKTTNLQTTSGYIAKVDFLSSMSPTIMEATKRLQNNESQSLNAIDMVWKRFQHDSGWIQMERIGIQMESVSDIEGRNVNYRV